MSNVAGLRDFYDSASFNDDCDQFSDFYIGFPGNI